MKRKFIYIFLIVISSIIFVGIWYSNLSVSVTEDDISVEGVLEINNTENYTDYEYLLTVNMQKNKDCHIIVYPYITGLSHLSYSEEEKDDYFVPGSIGSDGYTESLAINELKRQNIAPNPESMNLIGFCFPDELGEYQSRLYFDKADWFEDIKNPVLVCVYKEERYGKILSWTKIIPIPIK